MLIVDDNSETRELLAQFLGGKGFRTEQAGTGEEALNLIAQGEYKIVISEEHGLRIVKAGAICLDLL